MIEDVLEYIKRLYPDEMVLVEMNEFDRLKLAGKVELINEIEIFVKEEYGYRTTSRK